MSSSPADPTLRVECQAVGIEQRANGPVEDVVLRLRDEGQWFEPGVRVEYFYPSARARRRKLEKAALGAYEVLECTRVETNGGCWLHIRLQPLLYADPGAGAPAHRRPARPRRRRRHQPDEHGGHSRLRDLLG
jgi:hypothetical protein